MLKKIIKKIIPITWLQFYKKTINHTSIKFNNLTWPLRRFYNHQIRKIRPPKIPNNDDHKVYIHLGGGAQQNDKFINIDVEAFPNIHYVQNVEELSVLPDNSADLIYASHVLEHISHLNLLKVLKEWTRVLKKGGILRIAVPDFDGIIKTYQESNQNINFIINGLMGGQTYEYNFHKSIFNENYLKDLFIKSGLQNIKRWDGKKDNFGFDDFAKNFRNSLNLEGEKQ